MVKADTSLTFSPLEPEQIELVLEWLQRPHVAEWFHGEGLKTTILEMEKFARNETSIYDFWVSFCDGIPFGLLMTSKLSEEEASDNGSYFSKWAKGENMHTLDLLIGDTRFLGKGLSTSMIREFIEQKLSYADIIFIDPEASNKKAIHVYEKAGFQKLEKFIASWHPVPHWLMQLEVHPKNAPSKDRE